uniref:DUF1996 domain-containing protein n=1 Tax=Heterorhabditis bacteriophora TaxID=37862 RepID=A0A1I7XJG0_HETBA
MTIMTYCCCTCRALKGSALSAFDKILYVHISDDNFITDPENLVNAHFCTTRSSARDLARRDAINFGNYFHENANDAGANPAYAIERVTKADYGK